MAGTANNRRTIYTKKIIREEFLNLLQKKELSKITVKEIAQVADINRGTFYNYYTDPYDLFQQIEAELIEEVLSSIQLKEMPLEGWLTNLLTIMQKNKDITALILAKENGGNLLTTMIDRVRTQAFEQFAAFFQSNSQDELELYLAYFIDGTIGLIKKWLKEYPQMSPAKISHLLVTVFATKIS